MPIAATFLKDLSRRIVRTVGIAAIGAGLLVQLPVASADANPRYAAFVIDANNGKVLFNRYGDETRHPASLTKMMTLYMMFEALETGRAQLSTPMKVSAHASSRPPSKLGLRTGSTITVEEAMYALVTRSANDAAAVIGEFLAGTEENFGRVMTQKARTLGMNGTTFRNASGLPIPEQVTTARDMATLGIALREHFPQYYKIFNTRSYTFRGQTIGNHNRVLGRVQGTDGIKTGYINASGFNLVSSVVRGNKKLVAVVLGGRTGRSRDDHMVELLQRFIPQASEGRGAPLVASWSPSRVASNAVAAASLPTSVPVPTRRSNPAEIDTRVAAAYGTNAASAVDDAIRSPEGRTIIGRDALRAALVDQSEPARMDMPTAHALAPSASRPSSPRPRAPIPSAPIPSVGIDRGTTGSIVAEAEASEITDAQSTRQFAALQEAAMDTLPSAPEAAARSPWVVQIAATPLEATAEDMLAEAKRSAGSALASATAFTEAVNTGSQTLYRARFAGFETKSEANAACETLKRSSYACYAVAAN